MFEYQPPDNFLQGKTILITGAGAGIGRACVKAYASYGATVIAHSRSQEKLEKLYDEMEQDYPGQVIIHPLDFARATPDDFTLLGQSVAEQFECLDGLVHNAGALGARTPLEFYPEKDWSEVMQVNVNAVFLLTRAVLPYLKLSTDARVIFTSSSVGRSGRGYWGAYSVSKFAIEGMMQVLADELEKTSTIRVNSLNPGGTRTSMRREAYPAEDPESQPTPESIMPVYLYLMSEEAVSLHGEALNVRDFAPVDHSD